MMQGLGIRDLMLGFGVLLYVVPVRFCGCLCLYLNKLANASNHVTHDPSRVAEDSELRLEKLGLGTPLSHTLDWNLLYQQ